MGELFKPLLPLAGQTLLRHTITSLTHSHCVESIILVTGHRSSEVEEAVGGLGITCVFNPNYEIGGMVSSIQAGVRALSGEVRAFLLSLGDQPAVRAETVAHLVGQWRLRTPVIALPVYDGKRGHPLILSNRCIPDILDLTGDETLKTVVERYKDQTLQVPVEDAGVTTDVDTPGDYERLRKYWDAR